MALNYLRKRLGKKLVHAGSFFQRKLIGLRSIKSTKSDRIARDIFKILAGVSFILIAGMTLFIRRSYALDESLLQLIVAEMRKKSELRAQYNSRIIFKQKLGSYASMTSALLQPLLEERYQNLRRFNYIFNSVLNLYLLLLDLYRK